MTVRVCRECETAPVAPDRRLLCDECATLRNLESKREWANKNADKQNARRRNKARQARPDRQCLGCKKPIAKTAHLNRRRCVPCQAKRKKEHQANQYRRRKQSGTGAVLINDSHKKRPLGR